MFQNYLVTAWRHILKNRLFTLINVVGLAIGLMSCILILLFVRDELSYDAWIEDGNQIARLHSAFIPPGGQEFRTVRAPGPWAEAIKNYAPDQVEEAARLLLNGTTVIKDGDAFSETVTFADPSFFKVFKLPLINGDYETSFNKPLDLIVSEDIAIKYFGTTDVVGQTLTFCCMQGQQLEVTIRGVMKNLPDNSHLSISILAVMEESMFDFAPNLLKSWTSVNTFTYFKLKEEASIASLRERIYTWLDTESPLVERFTSVDDVNDDSKVTDIVQPTLKLVPDLHLYAQRDAGNIGDMTVMGDITQVYTFSVIAALILVIASINFMNLSTARAAHRAREVALRKTLGASRLQVASQFLGEAVAITLISLVLALVGVEMMLPLYNEIIGKELEIRLISDAPMFLSLVFSTIAIGVLSGLYPAAYLSSFMPAKTLKANKSSDLDGKNRFRTILVVFQFAISIGLIVCTAVIYAQTMFAQSFDMGYSTQNKLVLNGIGRSNIREQATSLKQELENIPGVESVVLSSEVPSVDRNNNTGFTRLETNGEEQIQAVLNYHSMGPGFFESYAVKPIAGRLFDENYGSEKVTVIPEEENRIGKASLVLNQSAVRALGFSNPEDAVGKTLRSDVFLAGMHDFTIIGVVPDLYFRSLKFGIRPSVYWYYPNRFNNATITYNTDNTAVLITNIERVWRDMFPLTPISHEYLNTMVSAQYQAEEGQALLFAAFAILAILIACLGLYGLAAFTAERRTKEIGIRKVLGATTVDIIRLLVWQFSRPILLANMIAWPTAWFFMSGWLEGFRYRLDESFIIYAAISAAILALSISWITVASRAFRIAQSNPIKALRYE